MSSAIEREKMVRDLDNMFGIELKEDFKRAGNRLRDILIREFEEGVRLAEEDLK